MNEEGSFLLVDFTAKVQETGELVDTTNADTAKEMKGFDERQAYEPRLFILGAGGIPKGLENRLKEATVNEQYEINVAPEEGYGQRDPTKVRVYPIRKFAGVKNLDVGARVDIDGKIGTIKTISSGRVSVDFNPPLAGKTLTYSFKVVSKIEDDLGKANAILNRRFPKPKEGAITAEISESIVTVKLPQEMFYVEGLPVLKRAVFSDISRYLKSVDKVIFVEEYQREKEEKPSEEKASEEKKPGEEPEPTEKVAMEENVAESKGTP